MTYKHSYTGFIVNREVFDILSDLANKCEYCSFILNGCKINDYLITTMNWVFRDSDNIIINLYGYHK